MTSCCRGIVALWVWDLSERCHDVGKSRGLGWNLCIRAVITRLNGRPLTRGVVFFFGKMTKLTR